MTRLSCVFQRYFGLFFLVLLSGTHLLAQGDDWEARVNRITDRYQAMYQAGEYREALDYLENEIESSTEGIPILWLRDRARFHAEMGRVDEGISDMEWLQIQRPSPQNALLLAELYVLKGRKVAMRNTLEEASERFSRARRFSGEVDNELALLRIRELLGENPRAIYQSIIDVQSEDTDEERIMRHLAAGEFAYRKHDYQLAATHYGEVLKLEDDHLEALAGLAQCYWRSYDPRLEDAMAAVLAINPKNRDMLAIQAEQALDAGKTDAALEFIQMALADNPKDVRFLSMKIAARFLDGDTGQMRDLQQWVLSFNPAASAVYRVPGRVSSRHYRFNEAVAFQKEALAINPDDNEARALLAFDLLRLGQDNAGRELLKQAFAADRFNVQVYNMLELQDVLDGFATLTRAGFEVRMPPNEVAVWGDQALDLLENAQRDMSKRYDVDLEQPVYLQIFDNHDDFMVRSVGLPGSVGHLGICFGRLITMDSPTARGRGGMNWRGVLWHEFAHVITLQKTNNRIPRWLSEGISVYEEVRKEPAWGERLRPGFKTVVVDGIPSLDDLPRLFTEPKTPAHLMFGYFSSGEFVQFYVARYGFSTLVESLELLTQGEDTLVALATAAGVDLKTLNADFDTFFKERIAALDHIGAPKQAGMGQLMPAEEGAYEQAMMRASLAMQAKQWEDAEAALRDAHALFPEHAGDDGPLAMLAALYERLARQEERAEVLEQRLSLDAANFAVCNQLAEHYRASSDWSNLRRVAQQGLAIDPFNVALRRTLWLAQKALQDTDAGLANLDVLIALDKIRAFDYRLSRVDLLRSSGAEARAKGELIELLEEMPYAWDAQRRLLELAGEDAGPG